MDNADKLITPMALTGEVLNTQFYDKINDYKTLGHNFKKCRSEEHVEKSQDQYNLSFDFETSTSEYKTHAISMLGLQ